MFDFWCKDQYHTHTHKGEQVVWVRDPVRKEGNNLKVVPVDEDVVAAGVPSVPGLVVKQWSIENITK